MTTHARLQLDMWRKPGHEDTPPLARHMYTTLLLDEAKNRAGVIRVPVDDWAADSGMGRDDAREALDELVKRRFVLIDGNELLIRTYIRNDGIAGQPNMLRHALGVALLTRSPILRRAMAEELWKLPPPLPPKTLKNGRLYFYPDPHETARALDPTVEPPDPPPWSRFGNGNPSANPSQMAFPMPSDAKVTEVLREPFPEGMPEGTGGGDGGGDVVTRLSVGSYTGLGRPARARERVTPMRTDAPAGARENPTPRPVPPARDVIDIVAGSGAVRPPEHARPEPEPEPCAAVVTAAAANAQALRLVEAEMASWAMAPLGRERARWVRGAAELLVGGIPPAAIATGMRACAEKGFGPKLLDSFVFGEANRGTPESRAARNVREIRARMSTAGGVGLEELEAADEADRVAIASRRSRAIESGE